MVGSASRPLPSRPLLERKLEAHLRFIYPERSPEDLTAQVIEAFWPTGSGARMRPTARRASAPPWSERDTVLITYGNSLIDGEHPPLTLLHDFLKVHLRGAISSVHVLPFFPWTSDDGFSVVDYTKVNSDLGSWDHLARLGVDYRLMADLVLNHVSSSSAWFTQFLQDQEPGSGYFIDVDPATDLSAVVRPRPHPLLRAVETPSGEKRVWCTFSHDQVDVNFANPDLLLEFIRIMRFHIDNGVRTIRLDAVAFVWKEIGTSCIHHPKTHEIVRLMRTLADYAHEPLVLITETNVPNFENLSYFGNRNEAHAVYNFSFPPLMVHALLTGDSTLLNRWQMRMPPAPMGCFFFNFLASHDGIGVRPVEGILPRTEVDALATRVLERGGRVSRKADVGGGESPYELNVSLFDALADPGASEADGVRRMLCAHALMLALPGVPGVYVHSLLGSRNDHASLAATGRARSINRGRFVWDELAAELADPAGRRRQVLDGLRHLLRTRAAHAAFHPAARQRWPEAPPNVAALVRSAPDRDVLCLHHVGGPPQAVDGARMLGRRWPPGARDLLRGDTVTGAQLALEPYEVRWIDAPRT